VELLAYKIVFPHSIKSCPILSSCRNVLQSIELIYTVTHYLMCSSPSAMLAITSIEQVNLLFPIKGERPILLMYNNKCNSDNKTYVLARILK
jgi:hypothetical protein